MRYDMVKEKTRCSVSGVVESGHSFGPFGEVIHRDNNIFVTIAGGGITSHEVDDPFTKWSRGNDRVKKSGGRSGFVNLNLVIARESVHKGKSLVAGAVINNLINKGRWKIVFWTCIIKIAKVCENANGTLFFVDGYRVANP
jgi:hypothetical protein